MPQATEELRAKFPDGDSEALAVLEANFTNNRGLIQRKRLDYDPTEREYDAIDYLVFEWDYSYDPNSVADSYLTVEAAVEIAADNQPQPEPTDAQQEPTPPGVVAETETILPPSGQPKWAAHTPTEKCGIHELHLFADCGEYAQRAE